MSDTLQKDYPIHVPIIHIDYNVPRGLLIYALNSEQVVYASWLKSPEEKSKGLDRAIYIYGFRSEHGPRKLRNILNRIGG
jgi:hypothetical protein